MLKEGKGGYPFAKKKSIDSNQPAQNAQADLSQNFLHLAYFGKTSSRQKTSVHHDTMDYESKLLLLLVVVV